MFPIFDLLQIFAFIPISLLYAAIAALVFFFSASSRSRERASIIELIGLFVTLHILVVGFFFTAYLIETGIATGQQPASEFTPTQFMKRCLPYIIAGNMVLLLVIGITRRKKIMHILSMKRFNPVI